MQGIKNRTLRRSSRSRQEQSSPTSSPQTPPSSPNDQRSLPISPVSSSPSQNLSPSSLSSLFSRSSLSPRNHRNRLNAHPLSHSHSSSIHSESTSPTSSLPSLSTFSSAQLGSPSSPLLESKQTWKSNSRAKKSTSLEVLPLSNQRRQLEFHHSPLFKLTVELISTYRLINEIYHAKKKKRNFNQFTIKSISSPTHTSTTTTTTTTTSNSPSNHGSSPSHTQTISTIMNIISPFSGNKKSPTPKITQTPTIAPISERGGLYNDGYDNEHGDYLIVQGEVFNSRYEVQGLIGRGSFGQVVKCFDKCTGDHVAIKIIKNRAPFYNQAMNEIRLLQLIQSKDPNDECFTVQLIGHFVHKKHLCLVLELLSCSLYDLLKATRFFGVSLNLIRKFAQQLFGVLYFLSSPGIDIIHSDLKPENILLRDPKRSSLKVIDFGSACQTSERIYKYIQSRFYRAPEVLLELEYGHPIDMWSVGCILVEMHTGEPLFDGVDEFDQMGKICEYLGLPPTEMILKSPKAKRFFKFEENENGTVICLRKAEERQVKSLHKTIGVDTGGPQGRRMGETGHSVDDYLLFKDLIEKLLVYEPEHRLTPLQALQHPFFQRKTQPTHTSHFPRNQSPSPYHPYLHRSRQNQSQSQSQSQTQNQTQTQNHIHSQIHNQMHCQLPQNHMHNQTQQNQLQNPMQQTKQLHQSLSPLSQQTTPMSCGESSPIPSQPMSPGSNTQFPGPSLQSPYTLLNSNHSSASGYSSLTLPAHYPIDTFFSSTKPS